MRRILGSIIRANNAFKMIRNGDKVCVGVSGGKDSMLLLYALALYKKVLKKEKNIDFHVVGVHLKINLCAVDYEQIQNFWDKQGVEFHIVDTQMGEILKANMKKQKIQCSLCSKMKKAILIDEAKKLGCNKVAMGHHADDAIETFFMNMINEGRIATFKPMMYLDRSEITFIRPLIFAREKDIRRVANKMEIPIIPCGCPMEGFTQRDTMKLFLQTHFYNNEKWKISYKNFLVALCNAKECDLWFIDKDKKEITTIDIFDDNNQK